MACVLLILPQDVGGQTFSVTGPTAKDYPENGALRVAAYEASGADGDVAWSLEGDDSDHFSIDNPPGVLRFTFRPDYEQPFDSGGDNSYAVTVKASDGADSDMGSVQVTVTVTDQDEPGTLTLSDSHLGLGDTITAVLADEDGGIVDADTAWTWERSFGPDDWEEIAGAASEIYTTTPADAGRLLRVAVFYTDKHGSGKTASAESSEVVIAYKLGDGGLDAVTDASKANSAHGMMPAFDPEILHYSIRCNDRDTMTLTLSAEQPSTTRLAVNGIQAAGGSAVDVDVDANSDVTVSLSGADGAGNSYVVHCLPTGFPTITTAKYPGAWDKLITMSAVLSDPNDQNLATNTILGYIMIIDNNGVPRFHRRETSRGIRLSHFKPQRTAPYSYSFARQVELSDENPVYWEIVILDEHLREVKQVTTVGEVEHTDNHDFIIREDNGNYLLMAYEPVRGEERNVLTEGFINSDGVHTDFLRTGDAQPLSASEVVRDSVIQEITGGREVFLWNSRDDLSPKDCTTRLRFSDPPVQVIYREWAHINSLDVVDQTKYSRFGNYVASFRSCSQVLGIRVVEKDMGQPAGGEVVWRLGKSNLSDEEWAQFSSTPSLEIVGDPHGEFCAQHSAKFLPNGHLIIFDNGGDRCHRHHETGAFTRTESEFSRAVEYALDLDNREAVFVRHQYLGLTNEEAKTTPPKDGAAFASALGLVEPTDAGTLFLSWGPPGRGSTPGFEVLSEVLPDSGEELLRVRMEAKGRKVPTRAYPLSSVALATRSEPLVATFPRSSSVFAPGGEAKVVVRFNQPVTDFAASTPSVNVRGAGVKDVLPHVVPGEPANAYIFTLTPTASMIHFALVADQSCDSGGICTAAKTVLSDVPGEHVIRRRLPQVVPPPPNPPDLPEPPLGTVFEVAGGIGFSPKNGETTFIYDGKIVRLIVLGEEGMSLSSGDSAVILPFSVLEGIEEVTITFDSQTVPDPPPGFLPKGTAVNIDLSLELGEGETVTVCLEVPQGDREHGLYRYNEESRTWEHLEFFLETVNGARSVCGETDEFSFFGVFVAEEDNPPVEEDNPLVEEDNPPVEEDNSPVEEDNSPVTDSVEQSGEGGCQIASDKAVRGDYENAMLINIFLIVSVVFSAIPWRSRFSVFFQEFREFLQVS